MLSDRMHVSNGGGSYHAAPKKNPISQAATGFQFTLLHFLGSSVLPTVGAYAPTVEYSLWGNNPCRMTRVTLHSNHLRAIQNAGVGGGDVAAVTSKDSTGASKKLKGSAFTKFNFMVMNAIKVHQARNL